MTISHLDRQGLQSDLALKVHCDNCTKNISDIVRIKCAECDDFDLCVECFSKGVELQSHKNNHAYHVADPLAFSIFKSNWTAVEELLFLEAIEQKGMGNFSDISVYIGSKSAQECKDHFYEIYLDSEYYPVPDLNKLLKDIKLIPFRDPKAHELPEELTQKPTPSVPANHEIGGYLAGRMEFDVEYDADAEFVVKDLEFYPDDTEMEKQLKLTLMEIYNRSLDLKYHRRMLLLERGLLDHKKNNMIDRKRLPEEKAAHQSMKPYARFLSKDDYDTMLDGLFKSAQIKKKIADLRAKRNPKVSTFQQIKKKEEEALSKQTSFVSGSFAMNLTLPDGPPSLSTATSISTNLNMLDIKTLELFDYLDENEKQVCSKYHLAPKVYLSFKNVVIANDIRSREQLKDLLKISPSLADKLFDFWVSARLITEAMAVDEPVANQ